jgi:hypothetical protein
VAEPGWCGRWGHRRHAGRRISASGGSDAQGRVWGGFIIVDIEEVGRGAAGPTAGGGAIGVPPQPQVVGGDGGAALEVDGGRGMKTTGGQGWRHGGAEDDEGVTRRPFKYISYTSTWARATHTCEILKLENMDEYGCYVQIYFSMINYQVSDHLTCPLHP